MTWLVPIELNRYVGLAGGVLTSSWAVPEAPSASVAVSVITAGTSCTVTWTDTDPSTNPVTTDGETEPAETASDKLPSKSEMTDPSPSLTVICTANGSPISTCCVAVIKMVSG